MSGETEENQVTLTATTWVGFEEGERFGVCEGFADDPSGAAVRLCCDKWAGGKHQVTVVNSNIAETYNVEIGVEHVPV